MNNAMNNSNRYRYAAEEVKRRMELLVKKLGEKLKAMDLDAAWTYSTISGSSGCTDLRTTNFTNRVYETVTCAVTCADAVRKRMITRRLRGLIIRLDKRGR